VGPPQPHERNELETGHQRLRYWGYTALVLLFAAGALWLAIDGVRQGGQERTFALLGWLSLVLVSAIHGVALIRGRFAAPALSLAVFLICLSLFSLAMVVAPEALSESSRTNSPAETRFIGTLGLALMAGVGLFCAWRAWRLRNR